jgi:hypothetical protein
MARFASLVVSKWPVALGVLVAGSLAVFLLLLNDGGEGSGLPSEAQSAGTRSEESTKASCLAPDVSAEKQAELVARFRAAGEADGYQDTITGPIEMSPEEARSVVDFEARLPETPPGWASTTQLRTDTPESPLESCYLQVEMVDPAVTETMVIGDQEVAVKKGAILVVRRAAGPLGGSGPSPEGLQEPGVGPAPPDVPRQSVEVQGQPAQLMTRDYDEPSVGVGWQNGGVSYGLQCSLMTVEECVALAQTVE